MRGHSGRCCRDPSRLHSVRYAPGETSHAHLPRGTGTRIEARAVYRLGLEDERRIEIWNHYASAIHAIRDWVQIIRYEDLVENPQFELDRFCRHYQLQVPDLLPALESRNRKDA